MSGKTDVLLRKIDEGVAKVRAHYEADLAAQQVSDELLYGVSHVIADCLSVLDWTANAVKEKYGPSGGRSPYFPLRATQAEFEQAIEQQIRGLRGSEPSVAAAFERHQPYQPGKANLGYLHKLGRVNKHQDFTPQTRLQTRQVEVRGAGGGMVSWGGGVTFGAGVGVMGVPIDPVTQRPVPHSSQIVTETIYVDWRFKDPHISVLGTLENLAILVREAVEDVRREAQL